MKTTMKRGALVWILVLTLLLAGCAQGGTQTSQKETPSQGQTLPAKPAAESTAAAAETAPSAQTSAADDAETAGAPSVETTAEKPADAKTGMPEDLAAIREKLPENLKQALNPEDLTTDDDFLSLTGKTMTGEDWSGASIADYDLTVIDCWATWCGPCREMMPAFETVCKDLPDNINVMGICFDGMEQPQTCRSIAAGNGVTYPIVLGDSATGEPIYLGDYTMGIPTLLFVNAEGRCIGRFVGRPLTEEVAETDALAIVIYQALAKVQQ